MRKPYDPNKYRRLDRLPDPEEQPFIRVEEAALFIGIGRTAAFEAAREYLRTDGASGLPAIRLGSRILIPVAGLRRFFLLDTEPDE